MTYTINKTYKISCAHHLPHTPPDHQCHRVHGHNYVIQVEYKELDRYYNGIWVKDFALPDVKAIINAVDHRDLNGFIENPTAENFAKYLFDKIEGCHKVIVWETDKCCASYER